MRITQLGNGQALAMIQQITVDQNNRHLSDISSLIRGYYVNDIRADADKLVSLQENLQCGI